MPKRTKQKPTVRPQPPKLPPKSRKPRRGTLPLTAFEQAIFQEMATENDQLRTQQLELNRLYAELTRKHNEAVRALGETHGMDFVFTVKLNEARSALNWEELLDGTEGKPAGESDEAPATSG